MADFRSSLKLGNVFNKVTAPGGTFAQDVASAQNWSKALGAASQQIGTSPADSGAAQAANAILQGASLGMGMKANTKQAQAQDAYNQWAQEMQAYEQYLYQRAQFEEQIKSATEKAAVPAVVALTQYKNGGDKAAYEARLRTIADSFATDIGGQLVNAHIDPSNDQKLVLTIKDSDGTQDTQTIDIANLVGTASSINKDLGTAGMQALGLSPPAKAGGIEAKLQEAQAALGRDLTEQERMQLAGIKPEKTTEPKVSKRQEEYAKAQAKADSEFINKVMPTLQPAILSADRIVDTLAETGIQTGPSSGWKGAVLGAINTAVGESIFKTPAELETIKSLTGPQVFAAVKNLGAGTGISNADREFAAQIVGSDTNTPEALVKMQAMLKASAVRNQYWAQSLQAYNTGQLDEQQLEKLRTAIYGDAAGQGQLSKYSYSNLANRFESEYTQKLNAAKAKRLGVSEAPTAPAGSSSVVNQFGLDMGN